MEVEIGLRPGDDTVWRLSLDVGGVLWPFVLGRPESPGRKFLAPCGPHGAFINAQAEAWALRQCNVSIHRAERVWAFRPTLRGSRVNMADRL